VTEQRNKIVSISGFEKAISESAKVKGLFLQGDKGTSDYAAIISLFVS